MLGQGWSISTNVMGECTAFIVKTTLQSQPHMQAWPSPWDVVVLPAVLLLQAAGRASSHLLAHIGKAL